MLLSAAITLLKFRLGSRTDADLDTLIPIEMGEAQFELERGGEPPWFLLKASGAWATTPGVRGVAVPGDFLLEFDDEALRVEDSAGNLLPLEKGNYKESLTYWGTSQGVPSGYALVGQEIRLFPIPDAIYQLSTVYFGADVSPTTLTSGQTNLWLTWGADLLLARTGRRMATYLRDSELVKVFSGEEVLALTRIRVETEARNEANRSRSKGD